MYDKHTLANGMRIIGERITYVNSVSIGIWIKTGSRNETPDVSGASHFIEHMLFKGTERRTAKEIAACIDNVGGQLNAFTSKENTCYYVKVLDTHLDLAVDLLSDMINESLFDEKELLKEKGVIIEEIGMYEDNPEEMVHDILINTIWNSDPLGMPILGTIESLEPMNRDTLLKYMKEQYTPENMVFSISGNYNFQEVIALAEEKFGKMIPNTEVKNRLSIPAFSPESIKKQKETEQVHYCIAYDAYSFGHRLYFPLLVLSNLFGGAMSSRLFQRIREELGLVYSVFSYTSNFADCGLFSIYAGMNPSQYDVVVKLIDEEIQKLIEDGVNETELYNSKEQLKGSYTLGLESTSGRMISLGKNLIMQDKVYTPKEILTKIEKVSMTEIRETIDDIFKGKRYGYASIGNFKTKKPKKPSTKKVMKPE